MIHITLCDKIPSSFEFPATRYLTFFREGKNDSTNHMLIKTSTFKLNPECGFKKSYQTQFENDKLVKKSDTMQQCPGIENGSHLGVSSLVPKLLQVFS